jgi:hypothetical protein
MPFRSAAEFETHAPGGAGVWKPEVGADGGNGVEGLGEAMSGSELVYIDAYGVDVDSGTKSVSASGGGGSREATGTDNADDEAPRLLFVFNAQDPGGAGVCTFA